MPQSVSTNRHARVCSKNRGWNQTESGGNGGARGKTDLAWRRSSPFHKSGVPLGAQTHLRDSTI